MKRLHICLMGFTMALSGAVSVCFAERISYSDVKMLEQEVMTREKQSVQGEDGEGAFSEFDYATRYRIAQNYVGRQRYEEAIGMYSQLLRDFPGSTQIYYLRGILNHKLSRLGEAKNDYKFLVDHDAADGIIFNNLGVICVAQREFEEAQRWFTRALEAQPDMVEAHNNLAELLMQEEVYDGAIPQYNKVIEMEQDNAQALYNLGVTYMKAGDYTKAREQWEKVLTLNPDDSEIKGILEQAKERWKENEEK